MLNSIDRRKFSDYNKAILLTVLLHLWLLTPNTLAVINSVNKVCSSDFDCTGPHEQCQIANNISPACTLGTCQCRSCYALNNDKNPICAATKMKVLGDDCTGNPVEIIVVKNAMCSYGTVICQQGFVPNGTLYCTIDASNPRLPEGAPCTYNSDCQGEMWCGWNNVCECSLNTYRFDSFLGKCVRRELDDPCLINADCLVNGAAWSGYTFSSGICDMGLCSCNASAQITTAAYVNQTTGLLATKQICVSGSGYTDLSYGQSCSLDPIYDGDSSNVAVCDSSLVCFRCPEDSNPANFGTCRYLSTVNPAPVCFPTPSPWPYNDSAITYPLTRRPTTTNPYASMSYSDVMMASVVNQTWPYDLGHLQQCSENAPCGGTNEVCLTPFLCARGVCACVPPYYWNQQYKCVYGSTTSPATLSTTSKWVQFKSVFTDSTVTVTTSTTRTSTTTLPVSAYYGNRCAEAASDCGQGTADNNLVCTTNGSVETYCLCPSLQYFWDSSKGYCKLKEFGDPCSGDSQCDNGLYTKEILGGFACRSSRTCGCAVGYSAVKAAILPAAWGASSVPSYVQWPLNRTYCLLTAKHTGGLPENANCSLPLAERSNTYTFTCAMGLTCLACPLDATQTFVGTCYKFTPPSQIQTTTWAPSALDGAATSLFDTIVVCTLLSALTVTSLLYNHYYLF